MKLFRMFLVSLALSLIFAGAALAKADVTELYAEALMTGDVESLDKLLAPNYWHVSANGHIQDKEHFLASLKERKLVIDRIRLSNMRSTVMGDVTLVTANGELKGSATPPPAPGPDALYHGPEQGRQGDQDRPLPGHARGPLAGLP